MNINNIHDLLAGTRFMVQDLGPELDGREAWDTNLTHEFEHYLERSGNRYVLTGKKRDDYRRWLRDPAAKPPGETKEER